MSRIIFIVLFVISMFVNLKGQWEILNQGIESGLVYPTIDFVNEKVGWIACPYDLLLKTECRSSKPFGIFM
jgi:hypothetical protein